MGKTRDDKDDHPLSLSEGLFTQKKILAHPQKRSENPKKIPKIPRIVLRIKNPYSLFGSEQFPNFLIIKSSSKNPEKNRKNPKKSEKSEKVQ